MKKGSSLFRRTLRYLFPYKTSLFLALICMLLFSLFNTLSLAALRPVINKGLMEGNLRLLRLLSLGIILLYGFKGLAYYGQRVSLARAGERAIIDIRNELFKKISSLPLKFFRGKKTGHLIARITSDVGMMKDILTVLFGDIIREPLAIIGIVILLFRLQPLLAGFSLVAFPLAVLPIRHFGWKMRRVSRSRQKRRANVFSVIQESITGIETIKAFSQEKNMRERFGKEQENTYRLTMKMVRTRALSQPVMEFLGAIFFALILLWGGKMVIEGRLDKGGFFTFIFALGSLYRPVRLVNQANARIQESLAGAERVFEILDEYPTLKEDPSAEPLPPFQKEIRYVNVSLSYDHRSILKDINLTVRKGEKLAIVGPSGVGKTSLVNLLPRFFDPTSGYIEIDGKDIRKVTLESLRAQIGIVSQETFLFHATIRENIAFGKPGATDEEIEKAARASYAHEFITRLPQGYDTIIGERGAKLSGGERQRIAIARAILKNPPILILDEATSQLDSESERLVEKALGELMKDRTVFIIAHRLSTVRNADRILVLKKGRIVEEGNHEDLMRKGGEYARLYRLQLGGSG